MNTGTPVIKQLKSDPWYSVQKLVSGNIFNDFLCHKVNEMAMRPTRTINPIRSGVTKLIVTKLINRY